MVSGAVVSVAMVSRAAMLGAWWKRPWLELSSRSRLARYTAYHMALPTMALPTTAIPGWRRRHQSRPRPHAPRPRASLLAPHHSPGPGSHPLHRWHLGSPWRRPPGAPSLPCRRSSRRAARSARRGTDPCPRRGAHV
eukprot:scaffold82025_cov57-Phaeocystis_antarctica.AAC.2